MAGADIPLVAFESSVLFWISNHGIQKSKYPCLCFCLQLRVLPCLLCVRESFTSVYISASLKVKVGLRWGGCRDLSTRYTSWLAFFAETQIRSVCSVLSHQLSSILQNPRKPAAQFIYTNKVLLSCFDKKQLNLSCFVSTWFLLSPWLFACPCTIGAGEWQQIVGMHLNETNYYMLTAFTMADLKELGSFIRHRGTPFKEKLSLWLFVFLSFSFFFPPSPSFCLSPPYCHKQILQECLSVFHDFGYFN